MHILFLVPTKQHKFTAGSRIRYDRFKIDSQYFDVEVRSMDEISKEDFKKCDVCIFSKTFSTIAISMADTLRKRGIIVGIDIFDDYFSQSDDPRLTVFRSWICRFKSVFQFALCSTTTMRQVIGHVAPDLPVLLVPDPFRSINSELIAKMASRALERCRATGIIDVLWFGIGSNPFFPIGLQDLSAYSYSLEELSRDKYKVSLSILCDDASMTPRNLMSLKKIPVPYTLNTWSVEREQEFLEKTLVAFIPVNGQSFSRAKSPNRALTAISSGVQVLSPGFPLYKNIESLIYTNSSDFNHDLERGNLKISADNIKDIEQNISQVSNIEKIMVDIFLFLTKLNRDKSRFISTDLTAESIASDAVLFGVEQEESMIHAIQAANIISIRLPYARLERTYDVRLDLHDDLHVDLWIRPEVSRYLADSLKKSLTETRQIGKVRMTRLARHHELRLDRPLAVSPSEAHEIIYETSAYRSALADLMRVCRRAFPTLGFRVVGLSAYQGSELIHEGSY